VHFLIGLNLVQVLYIFRFVPSHMQRTAYKNAICICDSTLFTIYQLRWHNIPEDLDHRAHRCENLKSFNKWDNYKNPPSESISFISHFSTIFHSPMMSHFKSQLPANKQRARCKMFLPNMHKEGCTVVYTVCKAVNNMLPLCTSTNAVWGC